MTIIITVVPVIITVVPVNCCGKTDRISELGALLPLTPGAFWSSPLAAAGSCLRPESPPPAPQWECRRKEMREVAYGPFSPVTPPFNVCMECSAGFHCSVFCSLSHLAPSAGDLGEGLASGPQHQEWGDASLPPGGTLCTLGPFIPLSDDPSTFPTWACASAISLTWKVDPRIPAKAQQTPSPPGMRLLHPSAAPSAAPPGAPPPHLTLPSSGLCRRLGHLFASH